MRSPTGCLSVARCTVFAMLWLADATAEAASSILLWPIDPVLESEQQASALWLENRGNETANLQVRVFAWNQHDLADQYQTQHDIIGSPPMAMIQPGQKQLVRLTRTRDLPPGEEWAYRVIIDEIPSALPIAADQADKADAAIHLQMRYSIPLFAYGAGLQGKTVAAPSGPAAVALSWRQVLIDHRAYVEIRNQGAVHARLTDMAFQHEGQTFPLAEGLLGYVLPGSRMQWPLPSGIAPRATLQGRVNGAAAVQNLAPMH
ncbi:molecular chaperone [Pseudomonas sp. NPDC086251]|uniref:fimbrial biogenesis chaperone n=1 Tax=Pseudomonas sp. NPDC086251 TaxID=3364431 RepID=UPI0038384915